MYVRKMRVQYSSPPLHISRAALHRTTGQLTAPQPPGPGFPLQAPSVQISTTLSVAAAAGSAAGPC